VLKLRRAPALGSVIEGGQSKFNGENQMQKILTNLC